MIPSMARVGKSLGAAVILLAGCDAFEPPPGTYRFAPPVVYDSLWAVVEECSGLRGDQSRISWFAVPGASTFSCADGQDCRGVWRSPHTIYVTESDAGLGGPPHRDPGHTGVAPHPALNGPPSGNFLVVRHEMLHDLLGGGEEHPPVFYQCVLMYR